MTVITPSENISQKWAISREASLARRPLENFLRARIARSIESEVDKDTSMLATTAAYFVGLGFAAYSRANFSHRALTPRQANLLAKMIFAMTDALADLIAKPQHAQVSAAVVVAEFFTPRLGSSSAARLSVEGMVWCCLRSASSATDQELAELGRQAADAILSNGDREVGLVSESIAQLLVPIDA